MRTLVRSGAWLALRRHSRSNHAGAYGRCPLTRREMPREMTADELQFVATDEDLKPPQRKELSYKCPPSDLLELRMRAARSDAMYQATVATARARVFCSAV